MTDAEIEQAYLEMKDRKFQTERDEIRKNLNNTWVGKQFIFEGEITDGYTDSWGFAYHVIGLKDFLQKNSIPDCTTVKITIEVLKVKLIEDDYEAAK